MQPFPTKFERNQANRSQGPFESGTNLVPKDTAVKKACPEPVAPTNQDTDSLAAETARKEGRSLRCQYSEAEKRTSWSHDNKALRSCPVNVADEK